MDTSGTGNTSILENKDMIISLQNELTREDLKLFKQLIFIFVIQQQIQTSSLANVSGTANYKSTSPDKYHRKIEH